MEYNFKKGERLLFDKPLEWTSFDVVNKVRGLIQRKLDEKMKVGHAGTLDPLATGLIILCTGKMTKKIQDFQDLDKEYITTLKLGATTPSFDLETEENEQFETSHITEEKLVEVINSFKGLQEQIPSSFSAKRVKGKRAYIDARKGKEVILEPCLIQIHEIEILEKDLSNNSITIRVLCTKGTYIRALARDIGLRLESGAYLTKLRRTKIGEYKVEDSLKIEDFEKTLISE